MVQLYEIESRAGDEGSAARQLAHVYAEALLDIADDKGLTLEIGQELNAIVGHVFKEAPEVERGLASPVVRRSQKAPVLERVFQGKVSDLMFNFLSVLNNKDRLGLLRHVEAAYHELLDLRAKRVRVIVRSVVPLTSDQTEKLRQAIGHYTGLEPIMITRIDSSLLGGMIVQVGDELFDGSVRSRIEDIRNQLLARSSYEIQTGRDRFSHPA